MEVSLEVSNCDDEDDDANDDDVELDMQMDIDAIDAGVMIDEYHRNERPEIVDYSNPTVTDERPAVCTEDDLKNEIDHLTMSLSERTIP